MTRCRRFVAVAAMVLTLSGSAFADERMDALAVEAARTLFTEGSAHFQSARWAEALTALQRSYALVPSPNTMLMIARSLRELGRPGEAVDAYEKAALDAAQRVAKGDAKYAPTERAATEEGRKLRATLGSVRVRVTRPDGATVTLDGKPLALDSRGEVIVRHPAGSAMVVVRDSVGGEQKQTVTVTSGSTVEMEFSGDSASHTRSESPPPPLAPVPPPAGSDHRLAEHPSRSWAVPGAIGSGVLVLAGTATFIGFGSASHATFERLSAQCGPSSCGPAERNDADTAERQQTIANVGLVVASVAVVATVAFVVAALSSPARP